MNRFKVFLGKTVGFVAVFALFSFAAGAEEAGRITGTNSTGSKWKMSGSFYSQYAGSENTDFTKGYRDRFDTINNLFRAGVDWTASDVTAAKIELLYNGLFGYRTSAGGRTSGRDVDQAGKLSIHQAYGLWKPYNGAELRAGRQELSYGDGFFISNNSADRGNYGRAFDSVRGTWAMPADLGNVDLVYSTTNERTYPNSYKFGTWTTNSSAASNDTRVGNGANAVIEGKSSSSLKDAYLTGAYLSFAKPINVADLYFFRDYFGVDTEANSSAAYNTYRLNETNSWGIRLGHGMGPVNFSGQYVRQTGSLKFSGNIPDATNANATDRPNIGRKSELNVDAWAYDLNASFDLPAFFNSKFAVGYGQGSGNKVGNKGSNSFYQDDVYEGYLDSYGNVDGSFGESQMIRTRRNLEHLKFVYTGSEGKWSWKLAWFKYNMVTLNDVPPNSTQTSNPQSYPGPLLERVYTSAVPVGYEYQSPDYPKTVNRHKGKLGQEYNATVGYEVNPALNLYTAGYVVRPGQFFNDRAWAKGLKLTAELKF